MSLPKRKAEPASAREAEAPSDDRKKAKTAPAPKEETVSRIITFSLSPKGVTWSAGSLKLGVPVKAKPYESPRYTGKGGKSRFYSPKRYKGFRTEVRTLLSAAFKPGLTEERSHTVIPTGSQIVVENLTFRFSAPSEHSSSSPGTKSEYKVDKPDLDNLIKAFMDCLEDIIFVNDAQIVHYKEVKKVIASSDGIDIRMSWSPIHG